MLTYPVLLAHGIGNRDDYAHLRYWGRVPDFLRSLGCTVILAGTDACGTIANNAMQIRARLEALQKQGITGVHVLGHSKGGLDARYLLANHLDYKMIRSLTTLCTPHRGAPVFDFLLRSVSVPFARAIASTCDSLCRLSGDQDPQLLAALHELTPRSMASFNQHYQDLEAKNEAEHTGPVCLWFGSTLPAVGWRPLRLAYRITQRHAGANDGIVPVSSMSWGLDGEVLLKQWGLWNAEVAATLSMPHYLVTDQNMRGRSILVPRSMSTQLPLPFYRAWVSLAGILETQTTLQAT